MVVDCDTGVDDAMAVLYGLLAPEIEVVALGTVWGNIPVELATTNTLRLLEIVDRPDIPVAEGAGKPLVGAKWELKGGVHGEDGQGNTNLPAPKLRASGETAAEQIVRLGRERPGELTLVPVGPLTNVATALALDPETAMRYRSCVLMGGNFLAPGNAARFAEANIWHDPEAAQIVLNAGWPVVAVGLDVTMKCLLDQPALDRLHASGTPAGQHIHRITDYYLTRYERRRGRRECAMHDALALGIAADPSLITSSRKTRVDVELTGTHTRGMTVADLRVWAEPGDTTVVLEADGARFRDRWLEILTSRR